MKNRNKENREPASIGEVNWERTDLINCLPQFAELYSQRPIPDNNGGMMSSHLMPMYFILKKLQPPIIVESGVYKGQGTWFFNKIVPAARILSVDINPQVRQLSIPGVDYFDKDVFEYDWNQIISSIQPGIAERDCLLFFDDHQNALSRLKHFIKLGFKRFIFEDNYPYDVCPDCYSIKKAFFNAADAEWLHDNLKIYYEFPPLFIDALTRWGDQWEKYPTHAPLLDKIDEKYQQIFFDERHTYTWICYIELK